MTKNKIYHYYTRCRMCDHVNGWIINPNYEAGQELRKRISQAKSYADQYPFDIRPCKHCEMSTRQERVGWEDVPDYETTTEDQTQIDEKA